MDIQRALEITEQCVRNRMSIILGEEYVPLPDCELAEMLEANEIVRNYEPPRNEDGSRSIPMNVAPRGLAASYAFEQYDRDPEQLLEEVGYQLKTS